MPAKQKKAEPAEGVALTLPKGNDRYEAGVPVAATNASATETKSGQSAASTKEN